MKRKLKKFMLIVLIIITAVIVLTVLSVFVSRFINSDKNKIDTKNGIQESTYIDIDGMKQYVQIRGKNTKNPMTSVDAAELILQITAMQILT